MDASSPEPHGVAPLDAAGNFAIFLTYAERAQG
jgi:hypothetical protein